MLYGIYLSRKGNPQGASRSSREPASCSEKTPTFTMTSGSRTSTFAITTRRCYTLRRLTAWDFRCLGCETNFRVSASGGPLRRRRHRPRRHPRLRRARRRRPRHHPAQTERRVSWFPSQQTSPRPPGFFRPGGANLAAMQSCWCGVGRRFGDGNHRRPHGDCARRRLCREASDDRSRAGGSVATVAQAARLAHSGDIIEVEAGDYVGDVA